MVSGTVLYCTVLYCTVLYCTVLYCTVHTGKVVSGIGSYDRQISEAGYRLDILKVTFSISLKSQIFQS